MGLEAQTQLSQPKSAGDVASRHAVSRAFVIVVSLAVAILFVRSSLAHLSNPYYFLSSIHAYQLVGEQLGFTLSISLPFLQIAIVGCLLTRVFVPGALCLAALLFAIYAVAQGSALWRGLNVNCGCFGAMESSPVNGITIAMVVLLGVSCGLACVLTRPSTANPQVTI